MSSTSIGDAFETEIFNYLKSSIEDGSFWAKKENCKLCRKKGYYSKDRGSNIIFDVSIEIYLPGEERYSVLFLVECKKYTHSVPVNDAEEFYAKVQQVGPLNTKAVLASTAPFQSGTINIAKSKGMGLLRYFDSAKVKWELCRSPSAGTRTKNVEASYLVEQGLSQPDFRSDFFDLYMQSPTRATNSLLDFIDDLLVAGPLSPLDARRIKNTPSRPPNPVPFLEKDYLESKAAETLADIGYEGGVVPLEEICAREAKRCNLSVSTNVPLLDHTAVNPILGRIIFSSLQILIYAQASRHHGRDRFTLAHELAHHLLGHGKYMLIDSCDQDDFTLNRQQIDGAIDIARLEFQANYFAASLLMPITSFQLDFQRIVHQLGITDKGFGALFVDNQRCNLENYKFLTEQLRQRYEVSKTAVKIRLESLGLLRDVRKIADFSPIQSVLATAITECQWHDPE